MISKDETSEVDDVRMAVGRCKPTIVLAHDGHKMLKLSASPARVEKVKTWNRYGSMNARHEIVPYF